MTNTRTRNRRRLAPLALAAAALLGGCASISPVVYPNNHAKRAGPERLQADIAACTTRADREVGHGDRAEKVVRHVLIATAVGGAAGAAWGGTLKGSAGAIERGRAAAAGGGAGSLVKELLTITEPDGVHRRFVEKCLGRKGYEVLGWR